MRRQTPWWIFSAPDSERDAVSIGSRSTTHSRSRAAPAATFRQASTTRKARTALRDPGRGKRARLAHPLVIPVRPVPRQHVQVPLRAEPPRRRLRAPVFEPETRLEPLLAPAKNQRLHQVKIDPFPFEGHRELRGQAAPPPPDRDGSLPARGETAGGGRPVVDRLGEIPVAVIRLPEGSPLPRIDPEGGQDRRVLQHHGVVDARGPVERPDRPAELLVVPFLPPRQHVPERHRPPGKGDLRHRPAVMGVGEQGQPRRLQEQFLPAVPVEVPALRLRPPLLLAVQHRVGRSLGAEEVLRTPPRAGG